MSPLESLAERIPYFRFLGLQVERDESGLLCVLPFRDEIRNFRHGHSAVSIYLGLHTSPAKIGIEGSNYWIFTERDHDHMCANSATTLEGKPPYVFVSFPSAKDPKARAHTATLIVIVDHEDFEPHVFGGLDDALAGLGRASGTGDRKVQADKLYRQCVALNEHMRLHIAKENELLLPKLEAEFDFEEQAGIAGAMAGLVDPQLMGQMVGWMYRGQTTQDREGMVRFLMKILPAEPLAGITGMLAGIDGDAWADVVRRIPELSASGG